MKKLFTIGLVGMTIFWAVGLMGIVSVPAGHAAAAGDLIKMAGNPAVYYLGSDSKRYVFPTQSTYMTWYKDFSGVVTVSQSELESYSIGGNVTVRPGTKLIKITTDPKTYTVESGGVLRWVKTEDIAKSLWGNEWYKRVIDVPDPFWVNYTSGSDIDTAIYPNGTLVKQTGVATTYYIDGGTKRPIADEAAFNANKFNWDFLVTAADLSGYADGSSLTAAESAITTVVGPEVVPPSGEGTLTVALAADTPAAATVVRNATYVKFTKVNFTASGADVIVDSLTIKRLGLAQDSNFANVYLLDAKEEMVGSEKTLGSTHIAVVNDDITIKNGETKVYYIAATMYSTLQAGEIANLALSEVVVKGGATVSGTLPIQGNSMTMNNTIAVGTITQSAGSSNPTTGSTSKQVGTTDYVFAAAKLSVNSTEDVQVEKIRWYESGTAADADVANLDLVVDGVVLATVAKPTDKAVIFDLSASPYSITKGNDKTFEIRGDIVDGSSRTIEFEFNKKTDIKVKGKTYGFFINPTYATSQTSSPYWNNTSYTTISTGTLTVSKKIQSTTYIAEGSTNQVLGAFTFKAQGEPIIISQIIMDIVTSSAAGAVTNITFYDDAGSVVAGPQDPTSGSATDTVTFTDTFTASGEHVYTVKGDLDSNFSSGDTIRMDFTTPATDITAKGETTNNSVTPEPASNVQGDTMTVRIATLSVSTLNTPVAQTVVAGTNDWAFAKFVLDASSSGEDVKVTQLKVRHSTTAANLHQDITNIRIYDGDKILNNNDTSGDSTTTTANATTTIDFDSALVISKGGSKTLTLKGNISGSATGGHQYSFVGSDCLVAYGVSTGNSITESVSSSHGQTQTVTSNAHLTIAVSSASATSHGLLPGDTDGLTVGVYNFRAQYSDIKLEEVWLKVAADNGGGPDQFDKLYLYDGTTKVAETTATTTDATVAASTGEMVHFDMSSAPVTLTGGASKDLTVKVDTSVSDYYNYLGSSKGESGEGFTLSINGASDVIARANGLLIDSNKTLNAATLRTYDVYKSVPTVLTNDLVSGGIASGTLLAGSSSNKDLYKFSVTADAASDVGLYKVSFLVTTSTATATTWYLYQGGTQVAATSTTRIVSDDDQGNTEMVVFLFTSDGTAPDAAEVDVKSLTVAKGTSATFTLKGTLTGPSGTTSGSVQVQFLGDGAHPATRPDKAGTLGLEVYENNLVWGDFWRTYDTSSTTASSTEQWTNGYLVPTGATTKLLATSSAVTFSK